LILDRAGFDHRPVGFGNFAVLEQQAQRRGCLAVSPKHEATGGVLIEPVSENRRARQPKPQRLEGGFQIGAALGTAMHR
jgi:hypothetical protein